MLCPDELRRTAKHLRLVAGAENDPARVQELYYIASLYDEQLREAEGNGRPSDQGSAVLLPSL